MTQNITNAIHECFAFHEALRRLGYAASDIFVHVAPDAGRDGFWAAWTLLRVRGLEEVRLCAGHFDNEAEGTAFEREWPTQAVAWNGTMTEEEREAIYAKSYVRLHASLFMLTLIKKGHPVGFYSIGKVTA